MLAAGTTLGPYRILAPLGVGGMGEVYLAEDPRHQRRVAIKVLIPEVAAAVGSERFRREIEITAQLTHPHILPVHDSGTDQGLLYYVMPYIEGESLRQRLDRERQLPLDDALRIAGEVGDALDFAHRNGVVHRDIKPENILLEAGHAVVADFGIARAIAAAGGEALTRTGLVVGTPVYMSPEQAGGSGRLDGRSDLYSLGCVLYEMLAGQPPFTGPTAESLVHQHLAVTPHPVSAVRASVPRGVDRALARALAKTPADRFATTAEFSAALTAPEAEPAETARGNRRTRQAVVAVAALAVMAGALVLAFGPGRSLWQRGPDHPARPFYVVLSEFEGPPDDPILTASVRDLVEATIEASGVIAVLPREQIRYTLQRAGKPDSTRIKGEMAREIAVRNGVRAVLDGSVRRAGEGYAVVLRVANPDSGRTAVTVTGRAADADALIPQTARLASRLLEGMKRRQTEIAAYRFSTRPPATSSFEAYRKQVEARRAWGRFDYATARQMFHEALALDPEFANAWASLGILNENEGMGDSARFCLEEALRHTERATTEEKLWWHANLASAKGDIPGALDAYGRLIDMGRMATNSYINRGALLNGIGRFDESLADFDSATARTPKGMNQLLIYNRCETLLRLGRLDEAREALLLLKGRWRRDKEAEWPFWAGEWSRAESVAVALVENPASGTAERVCGRWGLVGVQAARGQVTRAFGSLEQLSSITPDYMILGKVCLSRVSGRPAGVPPDLLSDTSHVDTLAQAFALAWQHDPAGAEKLLRLRTARKLPLPTMVEAFPQLVRAVIAADRQRWAEVVDLLAPLARQDWVYGDEWLPHLRWTVAAAYERMGRPDSAAVYFERALRPDRQYWWTRVNVKMASPFAHQRLVMLYVRLGRLPEAERHLAALERDFTDPDPDMRRLLVEARNAVMTARGMARPERPRT